MKDMIEFVTKDMIILTARNLKSSNSIATTTNKHVVEAKIVETFV